MEPLTFALPTFEGVKFFFQDSSQGFNGIFFFILLIFFHIITKVFVFSIEFVMKMCQPFILYFKVTVIVIRSLICRPLLVIWPFNICCDIYIQL